MPEELKRPAGAPMPPPEHMRRHGHASTGLFVVLFVLVLAALALLVFVFLRQRDMAADALSAEAEIQAEYQDRLDQTIEAYENQLSSVPPLVYSPAIFTDGVNSTIIEVNRETGEETFLHRSMLEAGSTVAYPVYAVPQISYDGRIIVRVIQEGTDNPRIDLAHFDVETGEFDESLLQGKTPMVGGFSLSPTQEWVVMTHDNPGHESGQVKRMEMMNLLTGEVEVLVELPEDEFFAQYYGGFGGASGHYVEWLDQKCASVRVFGPDAGEAEVPAEFTERHSFKEMRTYCRS